MESAVPKKASCVEEVCVKSEPSLEDVCIKCEPESSWDHSCKIAELCENVYVKAEPFCSETCVKNEPGVSAAALYADHVVKDELVLGPELVQPRRALAAATGQFQQIDQNGTPKSDKWRCDKIILLHHLTIHRPNRFFMYDHFNYTTNGKIKLLVHEKKNAANKPYKHIKLAKHGQDSNAGSKRSYTQDKKYIHISEDTINVHQCRLCSFTNSQESNSKDHERIHTGEKLYKCGQCSFASVQRSTLKTHKWLHTGEDVYRCGQCSFYNAYKHNLEAHERIHTGEKSYKCGQCSFASIQRSTLKTHKWLHTGEDVYRCGQCSFYNAYQHNLEAHERIHTGEKSYKCGLIRLN